MTLEHLLGLLATYKYVALYPLAIVEGHIISLASGFLARGGYINPYIAGAVIASGNLTGDALIYWFGYFKGESFALRWGTYVGITPASIIGAKELFTRRHSAILFFTKLTNGFGLQMAVLFTAGLSRVPFGAYMLFNALGEVLWTSSLISIGYIFGQMYMAVEGVFQKVGIAALIIVLVFVAFRARRSFFERARG